MQVPALPHSTRSPQPQQGAHRKDPVHPPGAMEKKLRFEPQLSQQSLMLHLQGDQMGGRTQPAGRGFRPTWR